MQSRTDSFMEALTNTAIGLAVSTVANMTLTPWVLGRPISLHENVALSAGFTLISIARSYLLRRAFNGKSVWQAIKDRLDPVIYVEAMDATWKVRRSRLTPTMKADIASGFATVVK
jgi:hypothetical protein